MTSASEALILDSGDVNKVSEVKPKLKEAGRRNDVDSSDHAEKKAPAPHKVKTAHKQRKTLARLSVCASADALEHRYQNSESQDKNTERCQRRLPAQIDEGSKSESERKYPRYERCRRALQLGDSHTAIQRATWAFNLECQKGHHSESSGLSTALTKGRQHRRLVNEGHRSESGLGVKSRPARQPKSQTGKEICVIEVSGEVEGDTVQESTSGQRVQAGRKKKVTYADELHSGLVCYNKCASNDTPDYEMNTSPANKICHCASNNGTDESEYCLNRLIRAEHLKKVSIRITVDNDKEWTLNLGCREAGEETHVADSAQHAPQFDTSKFRKDMTGQGPQGKKYQLKTLTSELEDTYQRGAANEPLESARGSQHSSTSRSRHTPPSQAACPDKSGGETVQDSQDDEVAEDMRSGQCSVGYMDSPGTSFQRQSRPVSKQPSLQLKPGTQEAMSANGQQPAGQENGQSVSYQTPVTQTVMMNGSPWQSSSFAHGTVPAAIINTPGASGSHQQRTHPVGTAMPSQVYFTPQGATPGATPGANGCPPSQPVSTSGMRSVQPGSTGYMTPQQMASSYPNGATPGMNGYLASQVMTAAGSRAGATPGGNGYLASQVASPAGNRTGATPGVNGYLASQVMTAAGSRAGATPGVNGRFSPGLANGNMAGQKMGGASPMVPLAVSEDGLRQTVTSAGGQRSGADSEVMARTTQIIGPAAQTANGGPVSQQQFSGQATSFEANVDFDRVSASRFPPTPYPHSAAYSQGATPYSTASPQLVDDSERVSVLQGIGFSAIPAPDGSAFPIGTPAQPFQPGAVPGYETGSQSGEVTPGLQPEPYSPYPQPAPPTAPDYGQALPHERTRDTDEAEAALDDSPRVYNESMGYNVEHQFAGTPATATPEPRASKQHMAMPSLTHERKSGSEPPAAGSKHEKKARCTRQALANSCSATKKSPSKGGRRTPCGDTFNKFNFKMTFPSCQGEAGAEECNSFAFTPQDFCGGAGSKRPRSNIWDQAGRIRSSEQVSSNEGGAVGPGKNESSTTEDDSCVVLPVQASKRNLFKSKNGFTLPVRPKMVCWMHTPNNGISVKPKKDNKCRCRCLDSIRSA